MIHFKPVVVVPPDPEKLSLEVGTPWVDRVYMIERVYQDFCHLNYTNFLESASAHLSLSSIYRFLGGAHLSLFINPKVFRGVPTSQFS